LLWKQQIFINKQQNIVSVEKIMIKLISQPSLLASKSPAIKQIELVVSITVSWHSNFYLLYAGLALPFQKTLYLGS
jgi:hypothetical protein